MTETATQPKTYRPWGTLSHGRRFWAVFDIVKDNPAVTSDEAFGLMVARHGREVPADHVYKSIAQLRDRRFLIEVPRNDRIGWEVKPKNH